MGLMEQQGGPDFHGESFFVFNVRFATIWMLPPPAGLIQA